MKVWIDQDLCTGDGLCEEIAPDVFTLLTWSNGATSVSVDLKIISSPQAGSGGGGGASAPPSQGYKGLRLPAAVTQLQAAAEPPPLAKPPVVVTSEAGGSK